MIILSIGSNLSSKYGNRFDNIKKCISLLNSSHIALEKASHFYETPSYPNNKFPNNAEQVIQLAQEISLGTTQESHRASVSTGRGKPNGSRQHRYN